MPPPTAVHLGMEQALPPDSYCNHTWGLETSQAGPLPLLRGGFWAWPLEPLTHATFPLPSEDWVCIFCHLKLTQQGGSLRCGYRPCRASKSPGERLKRGTAEKWAAFTQRFLPHLPGSTNLQIVTVISGLGHWSKSSKKSVSHKLPLLVLPYSPWPSCGSELSGGAADILALPLGSLHLTPPRSLCPGTNTFSLAWYIPVLPAPAPWLPVLKKKFTLFQKVFIWIWGECAHHCSPPTKGSRRERYQYVWQIRHGHTDL